MQIVLQCRGPAELRATGFTRVHLDLISTSKTPRSISLLISGFYKRLIPATMALDNKIVLITGGCGQVGLAITQYLHTHYPTTNIHILDLSPPSIPSLTITYHTGSITDASTISTKFATIRPEIVFHTAGLIPSIAARLGLDTEKDFMNVNLEGTRIVLDEARKAGVKAFVYTSSADVVKGNSWQDLKGVDEEVPIPEVFDSSYGKSKVGTCVSSVERHLGL
jgi:sterol-4alpha-carboxylate 3-dehydrogenase (decarboxylating)